ncbi:hypothetical protein H0H92_015054 [Tricholoma furcatifolium]|nr:hypothetical protein H0H92_015054 [Tricholoma furcatifolium]
MSSNTHPSSSPLPHNSVNFGASSFESRYGHVLQEEVFHSPQDSDSDSDSGDSQDTLEDTDIHAHFGHPLRRIERVGSTDGQNLFESDIQIGTLSRGSTGSFASQSSWSSTSSVVYNMCVKPIIKRKCPMLIFLTSDYENLIDHILEEHPEFDANYPDMMYIEPSSPELRDSLMIKCLPRTSEELYLLLELNHRELRSDPWNPIPHLRCAVERSDNVYLCMERLNPHDQPPFKTVANYIDFFKQALEGLTFLHELKIANLSFNDLTRFMVDLSSAPSSCESPADFDRTLYPVRYYIATLKGAEKYDTPSETLAPAFAHDVQICGAMIDEMLTHVPRIAPKMKSLVKAMKDGGFAADDARKLFEALCKSLDAAILETCAAVGVRCLNRPDLSIPKRSITYVYRNPRSA